ncbi:MAG TPA: DUF364 domain-containing protein [Williamwhitmania sp.]|nr:DUF364 domain-containing protein [Williamwhitmania sp.]
MDILKDIYDYYKAELPPPSRIVCGAKYFAVENSLGNVGLAANLGEHKTVEISELMNPHFGHYHQRVAVNAWINAYVNNQNSYPAEKDIFDQINFKAYPNIVMVGFFESLAAKFHRANIPLTIFDLNKQSPSIAPLESEYEAIHHADVVIVSSTSLANQTLSKIVTAKGDITKIMMLGPSTPLCPQLIRITGANILFGSIVTDKNKLFEIVSNGGGTKQFRPYLKKVYFQPTL